MKKAVFEPLKFGQNKTSGQKELLIVVCDDNQDIADSLSTLLRMSGCRVRTTYSGRQAICATEDSHPDVVLLDIGLPDVDGYQVARTIRSLPGGSAVTLIAITAYGSLSDKETAREAGFDLHLTKPVDYPVLEKVLAAMA